MGSYYKAVEEAFSLHGDSKQKTSMLEET